LCILRHRAHRCPEPCVCWRTPERNDIARLAEVECHYSDRRSSSFERAARASGHLKSGAV
jgi:hypothetical protein